MRASAALATAELAAAISQTSDTEQKPVSAAPAGKDPSASSLGFLGQHAALPATAEVQDCKAQGSLGLLLAADLKIADSLKSAEATMAHFHAMIEGDPQLAGQVGNEQIKMRAVMQVLQAKRRELLEISEAFQEGEHLDALPASAIPCLAEAEAFLLVADFTIKEARSRVLYSQAWPGQHGKPA
ncbi:g2336 [Coccomyxa viridis]|uniref:G2336 protein n=1 Tax=Coccomyxa viridis TaxID=1274662 RepID=A0ABP1FK58_9CHLO